MPKNEAFQTARDASGGDRPRRAGLVPQVVSLAIVAGLVVACANQGGDQAIPPIVLGMTSQMAALYEVDQT